MCCGDGVLLTFLAAVRRLLIFLRCSEPPCPPQLGEGSTTDTPEVALASGSSAASRSIATFS